MVFLLANKRTRDHDCGQEIRDYYVWSDYYDCYIYYVEFNAALIIYFFLHKMFFHFVLRESYPFSEKGDWWGGGFTNTKDN